MASRFCEETAFQSRSDDWQGRVVPLSPGCNMDVCSSFMAAVVTGRYTTSGHLTSIGDQSGGGGRPCES